MNYESCLSLVLSRMMFMIMFIHCTLYDYACVLYSESFQNVFTFFFFSFF